MARSYQSRSASGAPLRASASAPTQRGLATLCIGGGEAVALIVERV